jgi:hypothetical protein
VLDWGVVSGILQILTDMIKKTAYKRGKKVW